jgi:uncharacterized membrane protein (DUF4010 family)
LVSSTTVTWTYARLARSHPANSVPLAAGVATAWTVSLVRMCAIAVVIAPGLAQPLLSIVALPVLFLIAVASVMYRRAKSAVEATPLSLTDPFELPQVLKFGALLAAVTLIAKLASSGTNQFGLVSLAAVSGLVDVDPITLSVSRVAGHVLTFPYAAAVIVVAGGANLLCKTILAAVFGPRLFALYLAAAALTTAAGAAVMWIVI